jgi:hypothetical protein
VGFQGDQDEICAAAFLSVLSKTKLDDVLGYARTCLILYMHFPKIVPTLLALSTFFYLKISFQWFWARVQNFNHSTQNPNQDGAERGEKTHGMRTSS